MKYLITGGLGVIGSCYARHLAENHDVTVIDSGEDKRHAWTASRMPENVKVINGDLRLYKQLPKLVESVDRIVHAAASTGIPWSADNPERDWQDNVEGTRALLRALVITPKPTVALSSVKPFWTGYVPPEGIDELGGMSPDEPYAASKLAQAALCQSYGKSYGIPIVTFRCSNLYGPAPCHGPRHGWLTWFCIQAALGQSIEIQGTGEQRRDMLFATDVISACESALYRAGSFRGEVFNLGGGPATVTSVNGAVNKIRKLVPGLKTHKGEPRLHEDKLFCTNTKKAQRDLDWAPRVNVEAGIREIYEWAKANAKELAEVYRS